MTPQELENLACLRRARDLIDREYTRPLDVPTMATKALMSPAHFSRQFRAAYGETPYAYLMTRRIERAMALLREGASVTDACMAVGCTSLGSFSSRFAEIVGETPSSYRGREHSAGAQVVLDARPQRTERLPHPRHVEAPPLATGDHTDRLPQVLSALRIIPDRRVLAELDDFGQAIAFGFEVKDTSAVLWSVSRGRRAGWPAR